MAGGGEGGVGGEVGVADGVGEGGGGREVARVVAGERGVGTWGALEGVLMKWAEEVGVRLVERGGGEGGD